MKVLFLDESGDHNLSIMDPQYPLFVLGGVIMDLDYAKGEAADRIASLKSDFFNNPHLQSLILRDKTANIAGLQLADLVVTPIGRHILGKPTKEDFQIVQSKMRRSPNGRIEGYGLVVLPKEKRPTPATQ